MTCHQCRQEIHLLFGEDRPGQAVQAHLDQCDECRAVWQHQQALGAGLIDESLFAVDEAELEQLVAGVNAQIDALPQSTAVNIVSLPQMRKLRAAIVAAAAVILVVGAGLTVQHFQFTVDPVASAVTETTDVLVSETAGPDKSLGDTTVSALLYEYAQAKPYSASEDLLTDISDDEWQYLESEFDLGGLL